MSNKRVMKLASRGKRLGAYCIDAAIPFIVLNILMITSGISASRSRRFSNDPFGMYGFDYGYGNGNGNGFGFGYEYNNPQVSSTVSAVVTISALLFLAYIIIQMIFFSKSKTMGKAALGLQVISSNEGKPIGFWMMLFREWIVKRASTSVFLLGLIWVFIDEKNRGWHDKILDTYVVDQKESERLNRPIKNTATEEQIPIQLTGSSESEKLVDVDKEDDTAEDVALSINKAIEPAKQEAEKQLSEPKENETIAEANVNVNMSMKKDELLNAARKLGIKADEGMTKTQIIELIEKTKERKESKPE